MIKQHEFGFSQIKGGRDYQEDDYGISTREPTAEDPSRLLAIIADGMGGEVGGATASKLAIDGFFEAVKTSDIPISTSLLRGLNGANHKIANSITDNPELAGMGCTLLAVNLEKDRFNWISVGDSLLYLVRRGRLLQLNADHSFAMLLKEQVRTGVISIKEAMHAQGRNALLSAVTGDDFDLIDAPAQAYILEPEDVLLLASDGILTLDNNEIIQVVKQQKVKGAKAIAESLTQAVSRKGKDDQDNTTVIALVPDVSALQPKTGVNAGAGVPPVGTQWQTGFMGNTATANDKALKLLFPLLLVLILLVTLYYWFKPSVAPLNASALPQPKAAQTDNNETATLNKPQQASSPSSTATARPAVKPTELPKNRPVQKPTGNPVENTEQIKSIPQSKQTLPRKIKPPPASSVQPVVQPGAEAAVNNTATLNKPPEASTSKTARPPVKPTELPKDQAAHKPTGNPVKNSGQISSKPNLNQSNPDTTTEE